MSYLSPSRSSDIPTLGPEHLKQLFEMVKDAQEKWKDVGRALGFEIEELDGIGHAKSKDGDYYCFHELLSIWLNRAPPVYPFPCVKQLADALRAAEKHRTAFNLEHNELLPKVVQPSFELTCKNGCLPYSQLDFKNLKENERQHLIGQLRSEAQNMRFKFDTLCKHLFEVANEIEIVQLKAFVMSLEGCESNGDITPLFIEITGEINRCRSVVDLLALLGKYYSWFNFEVIERIVNRFFKPSDNIFCKVEEYKKTYFLYCNRSIFEYPRSISNPTEGSVLYVKSDINPPNLKMYLADLSHVLEVDRQHTLKLVSISRGCVLLALNLPSAIGRKIFPLTPIQEKQLASLGVQKLYCEGYYFNLQLATKIEKVSCTIEEYSEMSPVSIKKCREQLASVKSQVRDFGQRLKGDQPDSPESLQATIDEMMNTLRSITVPPDPGPENCCNVMCDAASWLLFMLFNKVNMAKFKSAVPIISAFFLIFIAYSYPRHVPVIACEEPPHIENGHATFNYRGQPVTAVYHCIPGYKLEGGVGKVFCDEEKKEWVYSSLPKCTAIVCDVLEDLSNGVVYVEGNFLNDKADYACDVGYKMAGQNQRICEKDGTWSGEPPKCNIVECVDLSAPINGSVEYQQRTYESKAVYSCKLGFKLSETNHIRVCGANGKWSGNNPTCQWNGREMTKKIHIFVNLAKELAKQEGMKSSEVALERLSETLSSGRIRIGLIGLVKTGKSSVLNALLRKEFLPTSAHPQTMFETTIIHSIQPAHKLGVLNGVRKDNSRVYLGTDVKEIHEVIKIYNDKLRRKEEVEYSRFELYVPFPFLANNPHLEGFSIEISDTAGTDEAGNPDATLLTLKAAERFSGFIFLINYQNMKDTEGIGLMKRLLENKPELLKLQQRFLFVVNQIDAHYTGKNEQNVSEENVPSFVADYLYDNLQVTIPVETILTTSALWGFRTNWIIENTPVSEVDIPVKQYAQALAVHLGKQGMGLDDAPQLRAANDTNKYMVYRAVRKLSHIEKLEREVHSMAVRFGEEILYATATVDTLSAVRGLQPNLEEMKASKVKELDAIEQKFEYYRMLNNHTNVFGNDYKKALLDVAGNMENLCVQAIQPAKVEKIIMSDVNNILTIMLTKETLSLAHEVQQYEHAMDEASQLALQRMSAVWTEHKQKIEAHMNKKVEDIVNTFTLSVQALLHETETLALDDIYWKYQRIAHDFYGVQLIIPPTTEENLKNLFYDFQISYVAKETRRVGFFSTEDVFVNVSLHALRSGSTDRLSRDISVEWTETFMELVKGEIIDASLKATAKAESLIDHGVLKVQNYTEKQHVYLSAHKNEAVSRVEELNLQLSQLEYCREGLLKIWESYKRDIGSAHNIQ